MFKNEYSEVMDPDSVTFRGVEGIAASVSVEWDVGLEKALCNDDNWRCSGQFLVERRSLRWFVRNLRIWTAEVCLARENLGTRRKQRHR